MDENKSIQDEFRNSQPNRQKLIIGYYNLRGKAQVCRLLCEYLGVQYKDQLYTLSQWNKFKKISTQNWCFEDLPYLKEGQFVVTEAVPICQYLIIRFGNTSLLGKNIEDRGIICMYLWTIESMSNIISINCQRGNRSEGFQLFKREQWNKIVHSKLDQYEKKAYKQSQWFLGYLTIIDFSIYQLIKHMRLIFAEQILQFSRLLLIQRKVSCLPAIESYQKSQRAITRTDPTSLLQQLQSLK